MANGRHLALRSSATVGTLSTGDVGPIVQTLWVTLSLDASDPGGRLSVRCASEATAWIGGHGSRMRPVSPGSSPRMPSTSDHLTAQGQDEVGNLLEPMRQDRYCGSQRRVAILRQLQHLPRYPEHGRWPKDFHQLPIGSTSGQAHNTGNATRCQLSTPTVIGPLPLLSAGLVGPPDITEMS